MWSIIAHEKVKGNNKQAVLNAVKKAMRDAGWKKFVKGKKVFLKINLLSHQVVPGLCTSPWILEAVLQELQYLNAKICVGDADVATVHQVERAAKNWGMLDLCKKYNAKFVNLSKCSTITMHFEGKVFRQLYVPKPIADADSIISIPVLKTHALSTMTCALKNQWGCLPRFRQIYHDKLNDAVAEMNCGINVNFVVVDATICSEGNGPRNSTPKIVNSILASADRVAIDAAVAEIIGVELGQVKYITRAEELGIGTTNYRIIGDGLANEQFKLPDISKMFVIKWEMRLRHTSIINALFFKTPLFAIFAWLATKYNTFWWYNTVGKKVARKFVQENALYSAEFSGLVR